MTANTAGFAFMSNKYFLLSFYTPGFIIIYSQYIVTSSLYNKFPRHFSHQQLCLYLSVLINMSCDIWTFPYIRCPFEASSTPNMSIFKLVLSMPRSLGIQQHAF
jgi:hypothetical protein